MDRRVKRGNREERQVRKKKGGKGEEEEKGKRANGFFEKNY